MPNSIDWPQNRYYEAPTPWDFPRPAINGPSIFLAGGITDCADWQSYARKLLDPRWVIFNPRRANFDMSDPTASKAQIEWEFEFLERAHVILFWFTGSASPQPITLYEFGRHVALNRKQLIVGASDYYGRRSDVVTQYRLARPHRDHHVHRTLEEVCGAANVTLPPYDPREWKAMFA